MANPAQPDMNDVDTPDVSTDTTSPDPIDSSPASIADKIAPKGTAYHSAVSNGAVAPTIVTGGSIYNGVRVPVGAKSVAGGNWLNPAGQIMADEPINPDGSVNKHSSAYVSELQQSMLEGGVNPIIIDKMMKPVWDGAKATQDMINTNSDHYLNQIKAQKDIQTTNQTIQKNDADLTKTYNDGIAEAYASGGSKAAQQVLGQYVSMLNSSDSTDGTLIRKFFPQFDGTSDGVQKTISTAVAQGAAQAQQAQASLTQTRVGTQAAEQGIQTSRIDNAVHLGDVYTQENSNLNNTNQIGQSVSQARNYVGQLLSAGHAGGKVFNSVNDIKNTFGEGSPEWASMKAVLATLTPQEVRQAIGAGNRMGQTEFNVLSQHLSSGDMPLATLFQQLGNAQSYLGQQQKISQGKLSNYENIAKSNDITLPSQVAAPTNVPFPSSEKKDSNSKSSGNETVKVVAPSGKIVSISKDKLSEALGRGAKPIE